MELANDISLKKCKRCGRDGYILSNGLCARRDDVLYGKTYKNNCVPTTYPNGYEHITNHRLMYIETR